MAAPSPKSKGRGGVAASPSAGRADVQPVNTPKVLRIGIIQSGKIIEERIIRNRDVVTVGQSEKNTFVLASAELPARFEMFETKGGGQYTLNFTESMGGRLSIDGEVKDFQELKQSGKARRKGKLYQLPLNEQARGKIVVGDSTVLFQFVVPPPIQPRPQLPAAVRGGLFKNLEWFITTVWIISLLLHVSFLTFLEVYDWPAVSAWDKYVKLQELIAPAEAASFEKKKPETVESEDGEGEQEEEQGEEEEKKPKQNKDNQKKGAAEEGPTKTPEEIAAEAAARAERRRQLAEQLAQKAINKIIGSVGGDGQGAIADVLRGGDVGADQDELLAQVNGVDVARGDSTGKLRGPAGGKGTGEAADISSLKMEGGDADVRTKGVESERKIKGNVKRKNPSAVDGTGVLSPQEVTKVVNRRLGAIKGCYERALRRNPNLEGKVIVRFTVAGSGKVSSARTTVNELGPDVGSCIVNAFKLFRFPPPDGGAATFEYPFLFTPAG